MAPRNTRVSPETQVRSPARTFVQTLDNYVTPSRDVRSERALQNGLSGFASIFADQAATQKAEQRQNEHLQGVQDAMREAAGEELKGVRTGSIFRQHSSFYMAGLNETRGKAAASRFKNDLTLAYQEWDGRHVDDDGSLFREWMNGQVNAFMGTLGENEHQIAGALPTVNEVARNFAVQHTGYTAQRLEQESYEAYDEIVSGVFSSFAAGELDMDEAVARIANEADDMYATDGAVANDNVVNAAIRYANIHNDPDAIMVLANAHDQGKLKLSLTNREKLANAIDAVEADVQRESARINAQLSAEDKAAQEAHMNAWGETLQQNPYAELPAFNEVGDYSVYQKMRTLQDAFIAGAKVENPSIAAGARMALEADLHNASSAGEKIKILSEFTRGNPTALSGADVAKYTKDVFESSNPGSLINNTIVGKYRDGFGKKLTSFQDDGFSIEDLSFISTQGEMHYNDYMLANAGKVDVNDPAALRAATKEAEEYAMEQLAFDFPDIMRDRAEDSPLSDTLGASQAVEERDALVAEQAKQVYQQLADDPESGPSTPEAPTASPEVTEVADVSLEEQEVPYNDAESEVEYSPTREGFYGEIIQRFTDGRDDRPDGQAAVDVAGDVLANDPEFASELDALAGELNVPMGALLAVMDFETGGSFSTNVRNAAGSGATGLIQFMPATARSLGTTTDELSRMTRGQQMQYVRKYFKQFPSIEGGNVDDVYMAVLWPKAIGKPSGYPIFKAGTTAYRQNAGLDSNGDGTVTKFEAAAKVRATFLGH